MGVGGRSELKSLVLGMKQGKGIRWANAASVEEGRRHKGLDFLVALAVDSVLSVMAAVAGNGQRWETSGRVGQMGHKS
jgi:hypothetical protein